MNPFSFHGSSVGLELLFSFMGGKSETESRSVMSDSLWPHGLYSLWIKAYLAPLQKCQLGFQWTCIDLICRLCSLCFTLWNPRWRFEAKRQAFRSLAELLSWSISLPVTFPGYRPPHHRYLSQGLYCLRLLVELGWWESLTGSSGRGWGSHDVALPNVAIRQGCPAATG